MSEVIMIVIMIVCVLRLPYLNGWITTISGILFDERRIPYHLLLSAFYHSGCHNVYFSLIVRYISLEVHREHSMEVEQLLQAWLSLTERLVNADAFNHSRHRLAQDCEEAKRFPALMKKIPRNEVKLAFPPILTPNTSVYCTKK
ncbi:unnamed protein product [Toxocara canis]|uniref:Ras-GEF domain-containing protein n=1 Tax=Toxocara canis TaxID=6265 RepID=A0A183U3Z6_TOXCA|nr:unnamed protein product [Toxocara canis]